MTHKELYELIKFAKISQQRDADYTFQKQAGLVNWLMKLLGKTNKTNFAGKVYDGRGISVGSTESISRDLRQKILNKALKKQLQDASLMEDIQKNKTSGQTLINKLKHAEPGYVENDLRRLAHQARVRQNKTNYELGRKEGYKEGERTGLLKGKREGMTLGEQLGESEGKSIGRKQIGIPATILGIGSSGLAYMNYDKSKKLDEAKQKIKDYEKIIEASKIIDYNKAISDVMNENNALVHAHAAELDSLKYNFQDKLSNLTLENSNLLSELCELKRDLKDKNIEIESLTTDLRFSKKYKDAYDKLQEIDKKEQKRIEKKQDDYLKSLTKKVDNKGTKSNKSTKQTEKIDDVVNKAKEQINDTKNIHSKTNNKSSDNLNKILSTVGVGSGAGLGTYGIARLLGARRGVAAGLGVGTGLLAGAIANPDVRASIQKWLRKS